ncbi:MAG TPA: hypothetical protein VMC80_01665 [Patescibacteria group bacterium]|nr:hypothetical protein [Patescibacteria group bacterium]
MAKNILRGALVAGLIALTGCAGVSYNGNNPYLVHIVGKFYAPRTEFDDIMSDLYTIRGIKKGNIKIDKVNTAPGQWQYIPKGNMFRWQIPDSDLEQECEKASPDDNLVTREETQRDLNQTEREATSNQ